SLHEPLRYAVVSTARRLRRSIQVLPPLQGIEPIGSLWTGERLGARGCRAHRYRSASQDCGATAGREVGFFEVTGEGPWHGHRGREGVRRTRAVTWHLQSAI